MASASTDHGLGTQFAGGCEHERRVNDRLRSGSSRSRQCAWQDDETETVLARYRRQGDRAMIILMLAAAMTIAMLIATAFGIHEESRRVQQEQRIRSARRFGLTN
jgi:hypothetical protein